RVILISSLFIVLGARIGIDDLVSVWKEALLFLAALVLVVRPLSVFISTWGAKGFDWRDKVFLSCMAPRGIVAAAVSSVFALDLAEQGGAIAEEAARIVPITYVVIVGTVALYGLSSAPLARWLGVAMKNPQGILFVGIRSWTVDLAKAIQEAGFRVLMVDSNYEATRVARMAGVPAENANILSDYAAEELDLVGIRSLVAATPNDQVNALACINLGHSLGPSSVFQLKPADGDASNRISTSDDLGGRLFGLNAPSSEKILELEESGAVVKVTRLTEDFDFDAYRERYGESSCVLFTIGESRLDVAYPGSSQPSVGDTLVSLVVEPEG
ncbi:MAG: cation:proton antiporter, partial [Verrucomicrobiota bacterium]